MNINYFLSKAICLISIATFLLTLSSCNQSDAKKRVNFIDDHVAEVVDSVDLVKDKVYDDAVLIAKEGIDKSREADLPLSDAAKNKDDGLPLGVEAITDLHPDQVVKLQYRVSKATYPKGASFRPGADEFWVTSLMNNDYGVVVFDTKTGARKKEIDLQGNGGVEIIFNRQGSKAFVSQMETGNVFEIDAFSKEIIGVYDTGSTWTKVMALSDDEDILYASNWSGNDVSEISLVDNRLLRKIPTVATPRGVYVAGDLLYVAGFANGEIEKINLKTGESNVLITTGGAMRSIVGDDDYLYASDMARRSIYRVNKETDEVERYLITDANTNTIRLTPDKKVLVVSNRGRNHTSGNYNIPGPEWGSILLFDVRTGNMLDAIVGGNQSTGLCISQDGSIMVYTDFLDHTLTVCELPVYEDLLEAGGGRSGNYKNYLIKSSE